MSQSLALRSSALVYQISHGSALPECPGYCRQPEFITVQSHLIMTQLQEGNKFQAQLNEETLHLSD